MSVIWRYLAAALAVLLAAAVVAAVVFRGDAVRHGARADAEQKRARALEAKLAQVTRTLEQERNQAAVLYAIGRQAEREKLDAEAKSRAVVADLRADNLRLRQHWQGCRATSDLSAPIAAAGGPDAAAELRAADAGRLVRIAAEADAQIRGLQAVIEQYTQGKEPVPPNP